jgi:endoglucanase
MRFSRARNSPPAIPTPLYHARFVRALFVMNCFRKTLSRLMFAIFALLSPAAARAASSPMIDYVAAMQPGTNWGNTLDAVPNETSWGAPMTTQLMIQGLAAKGYKSLRLPVTWNTHMGPAPDYTIDPAFIDRVAQIVQWGLDANLYVLVNLHHDGWVGDMGYDHDVVLDRFQKVWQQIATRFKNYPNKLSFESINEPGFHDASGRDLPAEQMRAMMDEVNTAFVHVVRATGGGNATRPLVLPPVYTSSDQPFIDSLKATMAHLNDPNLIATIHNYGFYPFSVNMGGVTKFDDIVRYYLEVPFKALQDTFVSSGIPVIIGEWGVLSGDSIERGESLKFHEYVAQLARKNHLTTMLWDTGGFYNRTTQDWQPSNRDLAEIIHQAELGGRGTTSESDLLFLKSDTANQDSVINLNLNGNSVVSVQNGATTLIPSTEYTLDGSVLTIKASVLAMYAAAPYGAKTTLTINVSSGPAWKIFVRFVAPPVASGFTTINGGAVSIPTVFNGDVLATIESRYADGSNAGPVGWSAFPFFGSDFHPDYANNAIVLSSTFLSSAPSNSTINFKLYFWSGKVLTYQIKLQPPVSSGGPDYVIYGDGLAFGWYDWGWMSYNMAGTAQVHSGSTAITINPSPYGGLALPTWATPDMSPYHTLTFWIHGGTVGGQTIGVGPILSDGSWGSGMAVPPPAANTWQKVEIPLSSFDVAGNPNIKGFYIQHWKGNDEPAFYIDDIHLSPAYASWQQQITGTPTVAPVAPSFEIICETIHPEDSTHRLVQKVRVRNTGSQTVTGPINLVLDGLSTNATLANATGWTSRFVSVGTSYITVTTEDLAPGKKASVTLEFSSPTRDADGFRGNNKPDVTYTPKVLSSGIFP